jgi:DNA invertase Pin-like site-specific DNA recombinase
MPYIRAYLRASDEDQDANRARASLDAFAVERGLDIASYYVENVSGATLQRPELFKLLRECKPNDILLTEQVDRLSRLNASDWEKLRSDIRQRQVRVVALDLPTSWSLLKPISDEDDFNERTLQAINGMMLDMLAAIARKDYDDRRRRQAQGIVKAKAEKRFKGRQEDVERNARIVDRLKHGESWSSIIKAEKRGNQTLSRSTLSRLRSRAWLMSAFRVHKDSADVAIQKKLAVLNYTNPKVTRQESGEFVNVTITGDGIEATNPSSKSE